MAKIKLLWFSTFCLLDTSSGAARSVKEMLTYLKKSGEYDVRIITASIFDNEVGLESLGSKIKSVIDDKSEPHFKIKEGVLDHLIVKTKSFDRTIMTSDEEGELFNLFRGGLLSFKPDLVWFFGGHIIELMAAYEARTHNARVAQYIANGHYVTSKRWAQDLDVIITNSTATSNYYKEKLGLKLIPVGKFISKDRVVAQQKNPIRVTFINPSVQKGAAIVAAVARELESKRPEIVFEVVQSRGDWTKVVRAITKLKEGVARDSLRNVHLTRNTDDMRQIYGRSRVLFVPSLWYESSARVIVEALYNGVPSIITDNGGMPEMAGDAGIKIKLPEVLMEPPYDKIPNQDVIEALCELIVRFYDDKGFYSEMIHKAQYMAKVHDPMVSLKKLKTAFLEAGVRPGLFDKLGSQKRSKQY